MSVVTLTLNPALDKSSTVERLLPEHKLRCGPVQLDAGGGGINVAKALHLLDSEPTAVFPAGGYTGRIIQRLLEEAGVKTGVLEVEGDTRENVSIMEKQTGQQYRFVLPGADLTPEQAEACLDKVGELKPEWLVVSGSLPSGLPADYYVRVASRARAMGAKLVLDTSGSALSAVAEQEQVFLLKPNLSELSALAGTERLEMNQVDDAALSLIKAGKCEVVVVSLGAQGALLVTADILEHVPTPPVEKRSTVGAGDSMVGGMVWALSQGRSYREAVMFGVACGTAATMNPGTRLFKAEDVPRLYSWIQTYSERYRFTDF